MEDYIHVYKHLHRLESILDSISRMDTMTYDDRYFLSHKLNKRIAYVREELKVYGNELSREDVSTEDRPTSRSKGTSSFSFKLADVQWLKIDE